MRLLLDSHILLWIAVDSPKLSGQARQLIADTGNEKRFSAASIWELAIKAAIRPAEMVADLDRLENELKARNYREQVVTARAARVAADLPLLHKDPFDRILIAQAIVDDLTLLTADATVARYPGPIRLV